MKIRGDFPVLKKVAYLDSACMSLRPKQVVNAVSKYYLDYPGCAGRSSHSISKKVTEGVMTARKSISKFINAKKVEEIVFTKNTTECLNLLSNSLKGKRVLLGPREHNSNLIPWLKNKKVSVVKENEDFTFDFDDYAKKVKSAEIVSVGWISNLDGYVLPVKDIIKEAHKYGAKVILDGAQAVPHVKVNVKKLGADFLAFSGHKMMGPSTGVLYGKLDELEKLDPFLVGGDTAYDSTYTDYKLEEVPARFEAGLQNYAGIIGLGAAVNYLKKLDVEKHCNKLGKLMFEKASDLDLIGVEDYKKRTSILNFNLGKVNCHDVAMLLDAENVAVRSGAHCVHSWYNKNKIDGSVRASAYAYNNKADVDKLFDGLKKVKKVLG